MTPIPDGTLALMATSDEDVIAMILPSDTQVIERADGALVPSIALDRSAALRLAFNLIGWVTGVSFEEEE